MAALTDPGGGVIAREGLGIASDSQRSLFDAVRRLLDDAAAWRAASVRCARFAAREYGESKVLRAYLESFDEALRGVPAPTPERLHA